MTEDNKQALNPGDNLEAELASLGDKYKGKTAVDIAKMHISAEQEKSRLGNELGTYRTMADRLMNLQPVVQAKPKVERKPVTADDLLTNPHDVLDETVASHPAVVTAVEKVESLERDLKQERFEATYPNYNQDLADTAFGEFIKSRPTYYRLAVAANDGDYDAANELWGLWSERKDLLVKASTAAAEASERHKAEKAGELEGSSGTSADINKTYSREEWILLQRRAMAGDPTAKAKWNDPKFQELRKNAYMQKLVK